MNNDSSECKVEMKGTNIEPKKNFKIIPLPESRWQEFKDIRLEALTNEPVAFADEYKKEATKPGSHWKQRLVREYPARLKLFLEIDGKLQGTIGSFIDEGDSDVATIIMVYVRKKYRGQGFGKILLADIVSRLSKLPVIKMLRLSVVSSQIPAIKTYESIGFKEIRCVKDEFLVDGKHYDEIVMERPNI